MFGVISRAILPRTTGGLEATSFRARHANIRLFVLAKDHIVMAKTERVREPHSRLLAGKVVALYRSLLYKPTPYCSKHNLRK
jgi:hypothetical protein